MEGRRHVISMTRIQKISVLGLLLAVGQICGCTTRADSSPGSTATAAPVQSADRAEKEETVSQTDKKGTDMKQEEAKDAPYNALSSDEQRVILHKGTEPAFFGEYTNNKKSGTYICRRCNAALYHSKDKFESHCGWPSFDDAVEGAVDQHLDADGYRVEIVCHHCGGHLGHVFLGEGYTAKDTRHCVNSISMKFIPQGNELPKVVGQAVKDSRKTE
jgi:peptide-methionine (R)-S-oxide reductase